MSDLDKSTSNSLEKRYAIISIVIPQVSSKRRPALGGDIDHPNNKRINSLRMNERKVKNPRKMDLLCLSQIHRPSRYGKRR
jgi:hypothetical protein